MDNSIRQSQLITKCIKDAPGEEDSINSRLLIRAGFIRKLMAGAYSFLPMGLRVLTKIENIIREEMNEVGGQEILMPALQPSDPWKQTGRWDKMEDILFRFKGAGDRDMTLGPTHEEIVTPLAGEFIRSYRDLPTSVYQIQTKYRNELRAKSGLLRGREFRMKDMYSFHAEVSDLDTYYEKVQAAYVRVFERLGLGHLTYMTYASGGVFSKYSHEYQTVAEFGEDTIFLCEDCRIGVNKEIMDDLNHSCPECKKGNLKSVRAIEVGNIFKLMTRFSSSFELSFNTEGGNVQNDVYMGCYGIGSSRLIGAIVEASHDDKGMIWTESVAPFAVHLVSLAKTDEEKVKVDGIYNLLRKQRVEVLYDDRDKISAGVKFAESDLIGIPQRLVVSSKTLVENTVEIKERRSGAVKVVPIDTLFEKNFLRAAA
jgi:prolyl-tRNA synthetase